jgi:hypothetical protein
MITSKSQLYRNKLGEIHTSYSGLFRSATFQRTTCSYRPYTSPQKLLLDSFLLPRAEVCPGMTQQ